MFPSFEQGFSVDDDQYIDDQWKASLREEAGASASKRSDDDFLLTDDKISLSSKTADDVNKIGEVFLTLRDFITHLLTHSLTHSHTHSPTHFIFQVTLTDAEATAQCTEWKTMHNVIIGVSWGSLPFDLQKKWLEISCDYHLSTA